MEASATLVICGPSASLPGWAEACAERGLAVRAAEGADALPDRDAGARLEQELEQVPTGLRVLVGAGGGGTRAFLHACRSRRVDAVILVDAPLVLADLSQDMPVQPLEMSLNLEAPVLVLDRDGTDERAAIAARLDPFAKPWDADRALGGEADVLRVARFLEEFLDLDLA
jgi:pimeloyl-ACP methyl ester carboxylesterase